MCKLYISNRKYFIYLSSSWRVLVLNFLLKQWGKIIFVVVQVILALTLQATLMDYKGRSSHPEVFLGKCVLKMFSKFTGEYPCWSVISIKLLWNFIEITLGHGRSPVNLLHISRTPFPKSTCGRCFGKGE